jgi:serine phosphatase RsbU (regulator of sigma subunit)
MDFSILDINVINASLILSSSLYLILGTWLFPKRKNNKYLPHLIFITIWSSLWALSVFIFRTIDTSYSILYLINGLLYVFAGLIATSFLEFSIILSKTKSTIKLNLKLLLYIPIFLTVVSVLSKILTPKLIFLANFRGVSIGFAFYFYAIFIMSYFIVGIALLFKAWLKSEGHYKQVLIYAILATLFTGLIDVTFNLLLIPVINYKLLWAGPLSGFIWCSILAYAITKKKILDINVVISRFAAVVISSLILIMSFFFFIKIIRMNMGIKILGVLSFTIIWSLCFNKLNRLILTPLEKKFLRGYYDINQILTNISSDLLLMQNRKKAMKLILKIFKDELETKGNYFILANCKENKFYLYKDNLNNILEEISSKHSLIQYFHLGNKFVLLNDLPNVVQEDIAEFPFYPKSLFYPVKSFAKMHGIFVFGEKLSGEKYSNNDLKMIEAITNQLTVVLDRLFYQDQLKEKNQELNSLNDSLENQVQEQVKEIDEKRKLERDLKLAKEIQERILPDRVPKLTNFKFETAFHPAKEVSGDYYDFLVFSEDLVVIVVADIVGKGVAASMLMIYLKNIVHQHIRAKNSPSEGLEKLNRIIIDSSVFKTHLPLIYAKLDIKNQIITYANAGSDAGLYFHKGKVKELETGGIPLGMDYDASFEEETLQLSDRDIVLFYTDGLTDARNEKGDNFGLDQVKKMVKEYIKKKDSSKLLVPHIKEVWLKYTDEENRRKDDMTLVSIEMEKLRLFENNT